ncbi:MAG: HypC/HybG/HupF family hydrogenase formation chaperone [Campylobacterota bacterium]|nr:HypC/HybG/HupF family hydrogenase formation chaperone [Campylobacterota bacterium]
MCLSIPSKVTSINKESNTAIVDTMGIKREVSLDLMEQDIIKTDDYVLIHIGFIMNKIDTQDALSSLEIFNELVKQMNEEELSQAIKDSEKVNDEVRETTLGCNCQNG